MLLFTAQSGRYVRIMDLFELLPSAHPLVSPAGPFGLQRAGFCAGFALFNPFSHGARPVFGVVAMCDFHYNLPSSVWQTGNKGARNGISYD